MLDWILSWMTVISGIVVGAAILMICTGLGGGSGTGARAGSDDKAADFDPRYPRDHPRNRP